MANSDTALAKYQYVFRSYFDLIVPVLEFDLPLLKSYNVLVLSWVESTPGLVSLQIETCVLGTNAHRLNHQKPMHTTDIHGFCPWKQNVWRTTQVNCLSQIARIRVPHFFYRYITDNKILYFMSLFNYNQLIKFVRFTDRLINSRKKYDKSIFFNYYWFIIVDVFRKVTLLCSRNVLNVQAKGRFDISNLRSDCLSFAHMFHAPSICPFQVYLLHNPIIISRQSS